MKQIILIRHAKVDIVNDKVMKASALAHWVEVYDIASISQESKPGKKCKEIVLNADVVLTSTLRRTIDSATSLGAEIYEKNAVFNEAKIPDVNIPFLKFKPKTWLMVLRVLLLFRLGRKDASLKVSKAQAKEAAKRLLELSEEYDSVVLMGHGGMNWLIRKVLLKEDWSLESNASNKNWGLTLLQNKC